MPERRVREVLVSIEREIQARREEEVSSRVIGEAVMRALRELDEVADIQFASVYKAFRDMETFETELRRFREGSAACVTGSRRGR